MALTVKEAQIYLGKTGHIKVKGLEIKVRVTDVKERWGQLRFHVTPISGDGCTWVEEVHNFDDIHGRLQD